MQKFTYWHEKPENEGKLNFEFYRLDGTRLKLIEMRNTILSLFSKIRFFAKIKIVSSILINDANDNTRIESQFNSLFNAFNNLFG